MLKERFIHGLKVLKRHGLVNTIKIAYEYLFYDLLNNINTRKSSSLGDLTIVGDNKDKGKGYETSKSKTIISALEYLKTYDSSVFEGYLIDYGSGAGRVLLIAAKYGFERVIGIEFSKELVVQCKNNIVRKKYTNITVYNMDAVNYVVPPMAKVFYFFNPFNDEIFKNVFNKIMESINNYPRNAYVIYVNPVHKNILINGNCSIINVIKTPYGLRGHNAEIYKI